jgi:phage gp36-like protein
MSVPANTVVAMQCITANGASYVTVRVFDGPLVAEPGGTHYISVNDIMPSRIPKLKLLQLVDDNKEGFDGSGNFQADQMAIINAAITTAENTAEGYASKRYQVADLRAKQSPMFVERIKDLAEVCLYERRPPLYPATEKKRDAAIAWLQSLKIGADALGLDVPVAERPGAAGGQVDTITGPRPQMGHHDLEGF